MPASSDGVVTVTMTCRLPAQSPIGAGMLVSVSSNDDTWPRGWSPEQEAQRQTGPSDLALSWLKTVNCDQPYAWALMTPDSDLRK